MSHITITLPQNLFLPVKKENRIFKLYAIIYTYENLNAKKKLVVRRPYKYFFLRFIFFFSNYPM